ncbi:hypothetical protein BG011_000167 [Mortierella polycephala]|uniref:USP8 dimerisation domain-containing protein n=1 Tax=Mortierella polycephala TaxID=41804 RepID=A0A9P6Q9I8_9FUNG|nr:hypothetical protein BG011_000167 [Mortierella polycephala]
MQTETLILPPKTRLCELRNSADFSSEEVNYSIKTWVNMASLLVKQGNMAESKKDDENAYISYVRACLIITKIIPHQALYPSMMNDIVCIDLRQKILGIVARMGHLERRLLKRFRQENQEQVVRIERGECVTPIASATTQEVPVPRPLPTPGHHLGRRVELALDSDLSDEENDVVDENIDLQDEEFVQRTSFRLVDESDERETQGEGDEEEEADVQDNDEMLLEASAAQDYDLEYQPHHQNRNRRAMVFDGTRSASPCHPRQQFYSGDGSTKDIGEAVTGSLRKKHSNEDSRSQLFSSPECQPNYSTMPSALFARHREGYHVRRCSSTDALRNSVHFTTSYNGAITGTPTILPRSDKRMSMMASLTTSMDRDDLRGSAVPDYRGTAASASSSTVDAGAIRQGYERELLQKRLSNRRTMSFESSYLKPMLANLADVGSANATSPLINTTTSTNFLSDKMSAISTLHSRKSNSISRINTSRVPVDLSASSRKSLETTSASSSSTSTSSTEGSPISAASTTITNGPPSFSGASTTSLSMSLTSSCTLIATSPSCSSTSTLSACSTPFASPLMKTSPRMSDSGSTFMAERSPLSASSNATSPCIPSPTSATSSVASSCSQLQQPQHRQAFSSISSATTYACTTSSVSAASSPTMASISSWSSSTSGMTAGLLRKIRSRPKVKDQMFEIVAGPVPPAMPLPALPSLPQAAHRQYS